MRITVFTGNQPRHLNLVRQLSEISDQLFFVSEVSTVFPGLITDRFQASFVKREYFKKVQQAEKTLFGEISFLPVNVKILPIKLGDLSKLAEAQLSDALQSDLYVVFGASFIQGWLIDFLTVKNAINIHMGLSPYYRGASCNFWALFDERPDHVGATIHTLSKGLDSGDILFHCIPKITGIDNYFDFTMRSVLVAHEGLVTSIASKSIFQMRGKKQDQNCELRYSKGHDFTDDVARNFLQRTFNLHSHSFNYPDLIAPIFG